MGYTHNEKGFDLRLVSVSLVVVVVLARMPTEFYCKHRDLNTDPDQSLLADHQNSGSGSERRLETIFPPTYSPTSTSIIKIKMIIGERSEAHQRELE